jgi:hypothetical protein
LNPGKSIGASICTARSATARRFRAASKHRIAYSALPDQRRHAERGVADRWRLAVRLRAGECWGFGCSGQLATAPLTMRGRPSRSAALPTSPRSAPTAPTPARSCKAAPSSAGRPQLRFENQGLLDPGVDYFDAGARRPRRSKLRAAKAALIRVGLAGRLPAAEGGRRVTTSKSGSVSGRRHRTASSFCKLVVLGKRVKIGAAQTYPSSRERRPSPAGARRGDRETAVGVRLEVGGEWCHRRGRVGRRKTQRRACRVRFGDKVGGRWWLLACN